MGGLILAFKKYNSRLGIWGSEWVGLKNFERIFATPAAISAIQNTFIINISRLIFQFPMSILLALLLNEMRGRRLKRIYQTVYTFPHFLSWIIVSSILMDFMSNGGAVNTILASLGMQRVNFLSDKALFRPLLYVTHNWKEMGWGSIIYMAAIAGIDLRCTRQRRWTAPHACGRPFMSPFRASRRRSSRCSSWRWGGR